MQVGQCLCGGFPRTHPDVGMKHDAVVFDALFFIGQLGVDAHFVHKSCATDFNIAGH